MQWVDLSGSFLLMLATQIVLHLKCTLYSMKLNPITLNRWPDHQKPVPRNWNFKQA